MIGGTYVCAVAASRRGKFLADDQRRHCGVFREWDHDLHDRNSIGATLPLAIAINATGTIALATDIVDIVVRGRIGGSGNPPDGSAIARGSPSTYPS